MSKDLTRRTDLTKSERAKTGPTKGRQTEVDAAKKVLAESMLFGASTRPRQDGPLRIIFGLDCTSSMGEYVEARNITPDAAATIANSLFAGAGGAGLEVQLWYFRGHGSEKELRHSNKWYTTPEELARAITIAPRAAGWTQHCALLRHAVAAAETQPIQQVVIISDAFERQTPRRPDGDDLVAARVHAARLRQLGVTLVIGYQGTTVPARSTAPGSTLNGTSWTSPARTAATAFSMTRRSWANGLARSRHRRGWVLKAMLPARS
jgi:hypothetical protein